MSQISVLQLAEKVTKGYFPDCQRPNQEVLITINEQLVTNFSMILGHVLFNGIPEEKAEEIYPKRQQFFDNIMQIVNIFKIGRLGRLIAELDGLIANVNNDPTMWPSSRQKSNICEFIISYFVWPDEVRLFEFFGLSPQDLTGNAPSDADKEAEEEE